MTEQALTRWECGEGDFKGRKHVQGADTRHSRHLVIQYGLGGAGGMGKEAVEVRWARAGLPCQPRSRVGLQA